MPCFSKFITSQRGAEQLVDDAGYIYSWKKCKDTVFYSAWRCSKYSPPTKCSCHCFLNLEDSTLTLGSKPHVHTPDNMKLETKDLAATLKRKAVEQRLTHPQNLITEVLGDATPELNRAIPQKESLTKKILHLVHHMTYHVTLRGLYSSFIVELVT